MYFLSPLFNPPPGLHSADQNTFTEEVHLEGAAFDRRLTYQSGVYFEASHSLGQSGSQSPFLISCVSPENLQGCVDYLGLDASNFSTYPNPPPPPGTYPDGKGGTVTFPIAVGAVTLNDSQTNYRDIGVYSQVSYAITEKLKLTGGFRYTMDDQKNTSTRINYGFPSLYDPTSGYYYANSTPTPTCPDGSVYPACSQNLEAKSKAPTWLLDLDYKPTQDILTYVSYKRGYRAGGIFVTAPVEFNTFKPEKVDTYELGLKSSFHSFVKGTFDIAGFYNDFRNQQLQVGFIGAPGSGNFATTAIANAGTSKIYGVEIGSSVSPVKGLVLAVDYTYLKTEITAITLPVPNPMQYTTSSAIEKGDPLALSPQSKYTVSALYTLPLSSRVGRISGGPTFLHTDHQLSNYDYLHSASTVKYLGGNWGRLGSRNLLDANLSWTSIMSSAFDVALFATNITHQKYYTYVPGLDGAGFETAALGEPIMYGASLRYSYGN